MGIALMSENPLKSSGAWILTLDEILHAAVGERELIHLIETPVLLDVPLSPSYCRQVLVWNQILLPTMDLAAWLHQGQPVQRGRTLAGIFAYQTKPRAEPAYGALLLAGIPDRAHVTDNDACALPKQPVSWRTLAISCFKRGQNPIPILDLRCVFTDGLF